MSTRFAWGAPLSPRQKQVGVGGAIAALVSAGFLIGHFATAPGHTCLVAAGVSAAKIQAAVNDCASGGTVQLEAGTYALDNHIVVRSAETISGAGPQQTFLVQKARVNIWQISSDHVTIENMSLDTGTANPGVPPVQGDPVPGVLFSDHSYTSVINIKAKAGTGFGMRLTGPNPCQNHLVHDDIVSNVDMTNTGTGGFTALDLDCLSSGTATGITVHGDYIAEYQSDNVILNGLTYFAGPYENGKCGNDVYVTGPANGDVIENVVTHNGKVVTHSTRFGDVANLKIINEAYAPGDSCTNGL
jgi:hypothetical protein